MTSTPAAGDGARAAEKAPDTPPVAVPEADLKRDARWTPLKIVIWAAIALLGGVAWTMLAFIRGETVNAIWFVFASVCTYLIGYRFYSKVIEKYITRPDDRRATPAEIRDDGKDYVPTDRRVLFGHHFAAIAGAGPLVGPVLAAQMGFLPGTIWIIVGVVLAGAVQDYTVLFFSMRRGGRSIGQMARDVLGKVGGTAAIIASLLIMIIIVAILALVVVNALGESPWGVFSVAMTLPIAIFMGLYLRFLRPGRITEVSLIGFVLLIAAIIGGGVVAGTEWGQAMFHLDRSVIAWGIIIYGFIAAVLPVWLLLAPRDYLSTFMKIGVIVMLAAAIVIVRPEITVPAFTDFAFTGLGPVFSGPLFPFLFVTIACGALSGFHALISSGTTPKMVEKERQTRFIGYGGMLMESFVAIMALVAAISIDQGIYFAMNAPAALTGGTPEAAVAFVNSLGLTGVQLTPDMLTSTAAAVGEETIISRTGGAPTLALGLAHIMQQIGGGTALMGFWYHFAIMFEALFILTAVDAGTRVARFMLQDSIGAWVPKFRDISWRPGVWICTAIMVAGWGYILILGVTDPLGGINTFFPLFGIANQLLAAIALAVVFAIVAKRGPSYVRWLWIIGVPLAFTAVITITASMYKIFSPVPAIGYWANNAKYRAAQATGDGSLGTPEMVEAVIRNTAVQGTLSIIFVVLTIVVILVAAGSAINSIRRGLSDDGEDAPVPSQRFAPAGLIASRSERELEARWQVYDAERGVSRQTGQH
ncbi:MULTISPECIES: carbon starvation CstA family protein [unclassified Microbacterium]|uniref:carbon starvation CstA family protein n=1 Tax=unclassified Microbacterium TaxID=2609290 RepID=UPI0012F807C0|nr:carbon starvation CstA family protein [Microbacterium sp. MAH-37]MVQ40585.1 carbon starvation protein A [Microbacterium sp. MAH-37]